MTTSITLATSADLAAATAAAVTVSDSTYARPGSRNLPRWRRKLDFDGANAKIAIVGDSTSDETTSANHIYQRLRSQHTAIGEALYGITSDIFTDGVTTSGSATVTSATAAFMSADIGSVLSGAGIPLGSTISAVGSATSVTISATATASASSVTIQLGRHIMNFGTNGISLASWLADSTKLTALTAAAPDLIIASFGLNDVRLGSCTQAQLVTRLQSFVTSVQSALPNADIVLRIPNTMLTTNVSSLNYVQGAPGDGSNINPAGAAQSYSTLLRQAYLQLEGVYSNVVIADVQADVFGTIARSTHPLMVNQLHPTIGGGSISNGNPYINGYTAVADYLAGVIGNKTTGWAVDQRQYAWRRKIRVDNGGSAFVDLAQADDEPLYRPMAQAPISTSDVLFIDGMPGPISLSSATFTRPFSTVDIRITGLTGLDFTAYKGNAGMLCGSHPEGTTQDRQIVAVDLPSTNTVSFGTATAAVTGARTGALHDATAVLCTPPATFEAAGLYMVSCAPSANDTVRIVFYNPTGGTVDLASANFAFWVIR